MLAPPVEEFELVVGSIDGAGAGHGRRTPDDRAVPRRARSGSRRAGVRGEAHRGEAVFVERHRRPGPARRGGAASRSPAPPRRAARAAGRRAWIAWPRTACLEQARTAAGRAAASPRASGWSIHGLPSCLSASMSASTMIRASSLGVDLRLPAEVAARPCAASPISASTSVGRR